MWKMSIYFQTIERYGKELVSNWYSDGTVHRRAEARGIVSDYLWFWRGICAQSSCSLSFCFAYLLSNGLYRKIPKISPPPGRGRLVLGKLPLNTKENKAKRVNLLPAITLAQSISKRTFPSVDKPLRIKGPLKNISPRAYFRNFMVFLRELDLHILENSNLVLVYSLGLMYLGFWTSILQN